MNLNKVYIVIIINLTVILIVHGQPSDQSSSSSSSSTQQQPPGYYAFEKATRIHGVPPRVLKPPYIPENVQCPGSTKSDHRLSPRDTLCGDLNRGYVPLNPMSQSIAGQPYPFELIKNKTLHFLARSLPFLKQDINNIPKVAKIPTDAKLGTIGDFPAKPNNIHIGGHYDYTANNHLIKKRSLANLPNLRWDMFREAKFAGHGFNYTEARQKVCEQNEGILCQVMSALGGSSPVSSGLLNTINSAAQVMSTASNAASTAQALSSLIQHFTGSGSNSGSISSSSSGSSTPSSASLTSSSSSGSSSSSSSSGSSFNSEVTKSMFQQLLNILASLNTNSGSSSTVSPTTSSFSPLSAIVEYLVSVNPTAISGLLPARRKKPLDFEDIANEAMTVSQVPPTPCPSIEEYVAPVYARNYQGIWKYVVQIPHEGYFTQTVQKTTCVKQRCDFMEGVCHESPRWVSLLVAEIFYPEPKFPNLIPSPSEIKAYSVSPMFNKAKHHINNGLNGAAGHLSHSHNQMKHPINNYPNLNHHLPVGGGLAGQPMSYPEIDQYLNRKIGYREEPMMMATNEHRRGAKPRMMMYNDEDKAQIVSSSHSAASAGSTPLPPLPSPLQPQQSPSSSSSTSNNRKTETVKEEECDGHDTVGCYQMRVYYDWFLIPGSCKCWKKTASQGSSLDALKKLFIGK